MPKTGHIPVSPSLLPKDDPRFIKWKESLKKRPPPWCKGKNKYTDLSVKKISDTFKRKKIDNFSNWRINARKIGLIPSSYPSLKKDLNFAFLFGLVSGDGHIDKFPRTEKITIALGIDKPELIDFTASIVEEVFSKKPAVKKTSYSNMVRVSFYQKYISKRLKVPSGNRGKIRIKIPSWIRTNRKYLLACLRGLYEAEGSLSIHLPTYTYNFAFSNKNTSLLKFVSKSLIDLGFHPEVRSYAIRLRKKEEVKYFENLIKFRKYGAGWCNGCTRPSGGRDRGSNPCPAAKQGTHATEMPRKARKHL